MSLELRVLLLVVGVAGSLALCVWLTRALLREMAKGWELDARRRGEGWERGSERLAEGKGAGSGRAGEGYSDSRG